jgi:hypothetical protein
MAADEPDASGTELGRLQEEIAELQERVAELRRRIGERADYPTDPEEVSMLLTEVGEQEAILATLKARRDQRKESLGQR